MTNIRRRWLGNSAANLLGGVSTVMFNIAVPAIIARRLPSEEFSVWSLSLQVMGYVGLLGIGLQTATARLIARDHDVDARPSMACSMRAATTISRWAATIAVLISGVLTFAYPRFFPDIPAHLITSFQICVAAIGTAAGLQLLALPHMGVFQGIHQNFRFVHAQLCVRVGSLLIIAIGAWLGWHSSALAIALALVMACLLPLTTIQLHRALPWLRAQPVIEAYTQRRHELLGDCWTLSVWTLSMFLVNSVGMLMVGRVDFASSGAYAIALTAAGSLAGLLGALMSPLLTTAAGIYGDPQTKTALPKLLDRSTFWCASGLHAMYIGFLLLHRPLLDLWLGTHLAEQAAPLALVLVGAHALRNVAAPYSLMLLATGLNRRALWTGVAEGASNLLATILLGLHYGVLGVAMGTLVGAIVGVVASCLFNVPRTPEISPRPRLFVLKSMVLPTAIAAPVYAACVRLVFF